MSNMTKQSPEISILSLPHDLLLNCLARISRLYYPTLSLVSKNFRAVVASLELYQTRSRLNLTESCLYLCLRYHLDRLRDPTTNWFALCKKPNQNLTDRSSGFLFIPITSPYLRHERSLSLTSTDVSLVAVGSNIYRIGGYTPFPTSKVSVLDCRFNTWHSAPPMREKRSSPAASVVDGKIYVAGGFEELSSVDWVEVFDPKTQTWGKVTDPASEIRPSRAELESFELGGKLYVFGDKRVVYDPKEASWNMIELDMDIYMDMDEDIAMAMDMDEAMDMEMDMNRVASAVSYSHGVIGDVLFLWNKREFRWFDFKSSSWKKLRGVEDLPDFGGDCKMVDVDGKMAVLWEVYRRLDEHNEEICIWCAEIGIERRGDEMWGKVEWFDVVLTTHEPCTLSDADVISATV
ncbi:F-box/kelch-repeat protein At4g39590 [Raphanus sativus]|uniref:F-box/kelch-repeat protein At4g39590 n=1 Tax=Raphanus sativus TaxID=3726 RepID=A0A9W3DK63_RAPSA|nr:F-box/kelch-repeat protein At4g39590 [Raphanus sativus]